MNNEITKTVEFGDVPEAIIDMNHKGYLLIDTEAIQDTVRLTFRKEMRQNMSNQVKREFEEMKHKLSELEYNLRHVADTVEIDYVECGEEECDHCDCYKSDDL